MASESDQGSPVRDPSESPETLATLPGPPAGLPPWAKVLWFIGETVAYGVMYLAYDYGQEIVASALGADDPNATTWRKFVVHANDTTSATTADDQQMTFDVVNYTNGAIDNTWTTADFNLVADQLNLFCINIASAISNRITFDRVTAYTRAFNPYANLKPFADSGAPVFEKALAVVGVGGFAEAPQVSSTITERTPTRTNWGRIYLPTLGDLVVDVNGRLKNTAVDALATAYHDLVVTLAASEMHVVVPTTSVSKHPVRTLQGVTGVSVDNVLDIQRRRRHKITTYRHILPVAATQSPAGS